MNYKTVAQNPLSFFITRTELFGTESLEHINNQYDRTSNNFKSSKTQSDLAVSGCEKISCSKLSSTRCPFYDRFRKKGAVFRLFGAEKFDEKTRTRKREICGLLPYFL